MNGQARMDSITHLIQDQGLTLELQREETLAVKDLEEWEFREEIFWKEKYCIHWLQEGDRNTSFFHNFVKARRNGNLITSLVTSEGVQLSSKWDIS